MSKIALKSKYLHVVYARSWCCRHWFHTSRNTVLPNMARGEKLVCPVAYNEPEYAKCFKPAKLPVIDAPCLAGEPRNVTPPTQGIEPEIYEKWNQMPKKSLHKELAKLSVYY